MVYPSKGSELKTAILNALEKHASPENGLGFNTLFEVVNKKAGGSRRTFNKYLNELISTGAVKKDKDPRHKIGVIIYRTDAATQEQVLIDLTDRIFTMTRPSSILKAAMDDEVKHEIRKRDLRKKEDVTDKVVGEINESLRESLRMWRMAQVSDVLGRHFRKLIPFEGEGLTYAYARVVRDDKEKERAEINLISDDGEQKIEYSFSSPGEPPLPPIFKVTRGRSISVPLPPDKESRHAIMMKFATTDILTRGGFEQAQKLSEGILAEYPPAERERLRQAISKPKEHLLIKTQIDGLPLSRTKEGKVDR